MTKHDRKIFEFLGWKLFFLVENSEHEILSLTIHDKKTDEKLCSLNLNISVLLVEDKLFFQTSLLSKIQINFIY